MDDTLISDNGPQFANTQMRQFAKDYGFTHITISPGFASSNGQIERTVRAVKNLILTWHYLTTVIRQ